MPTAVAPDRFAKMANGGGIFVSYRRDDRSGYALLLYDWLIPTFGRDRVFCDIEGTRPGWDFVAALENLMADRAALISLIGKQWLCMQDGAGRRALRDHLYLVTEAEFFRPNSQPKTE